MSDAFPVIRSYNLAQHVTKPLWDKLSRAVTKTSGFSLEKAIACAVQLDDQLVGIYAGDWDSYKVFADVFDPVIKQYHGITNFSNFTSDMDTSKIKGNIDPAAPVHSIRIRVGRSIDGFPLSPGITKEQRVTLENLMKTSFSHLKDDLAGSYFSLAGMKEDVRQQLVEDNFLFFDSNGGDPNLMAAFMERDWPEGRGIFLNKEKTFLTWVNEEDQLRIISMQKGGDLKAVFDRLSRGVQAIGDSVKAESGKDFMLDARLGYITTCPTNLGTGMRASVEVDLPCWTKEGEVAVLCRCGDLDIYARTTRGESGGLGTLYDLSNEHRFGYTEVQLIQKLIDGVNILYKEDLELQKKHGL